MPSPRQWAAGFPLPAQLTGHPTICFQMEIPDTPEYRAAVLGHMAQLGFWSAWEKAGPGTGDTRAATVAQIFRRLWTETARFTEVCCDGERDGCIEYPPSAPFIEWHPNDPFLSPDETPSGYVNPPWYVADGNAATLLGVAVGDVVTDTLRFQSIPIIPPPSGYPRFRVHLRGSGTVELHLAHVLSGGYAQITQDDNPLTVEFIDLNRDVLAVPPETTDVVVIEREIEGSGRHHIDVLMIPKANDSINFLGQGGGLRRVVLCGFTEMAREIEMRSVAVDGCDNIEWRYRDEDDSAWRLLSTVCDGEDGQDGQDGAPGADGVCPECPEPGDDDGAAVPDPEPELSACDVAHRVTTNMLDVYVSPAIAEAAVEIAQNGQSYLDFGRNWVAAMLTVGVSYVMGHAIAFFRMFETRDMVNLWATAQSAGFADAAACELYCTIAPETSITAAHLGSWLSAMESGAGHFEGFDTTLTGGVAEFLRGFPITHYRLEALYAQPGDGDCSACQCEGEWCYTWDLTAEPGPLMAQETYSDKIDDVVHSSIWVAGKGWGNGSNVAGTAFGGYYKAYGYPFPTVFSTFNLWGLYSIEYEWVGNVDQTRNIAWGAPVGDLPPTTYTQEEWAIDNPQARTDIYGEIKIALPGGQGAGPEEVYLTKLTLRGTGNNPFGPDNCEDPT